MTGAEELAPVCTLRCSVPMAAARRSSSEGLLYPKPKRMFRKIIPMPGAFLIPYLAMILGLYVFHSAWIAFAIYHGSIGVLLATGKTARYRQELSEGWDVKLGLVAAVFGLGGGVIIVLLAPLAGINQASLQPALATLGLEGNSWLLFIFYHSLINPWFEEVFWRSRLGSDSTHLTMNDLLFAGYHLLVLVLFLDPEWMVLSFVVLTFSGWLWRQMKRRQKGLLMPIVSHICADASIMAAVFVLSR